MQQEIDQRDVFNFLADPRTHKLSEPIRRIDTHAAAIFLAGRDVYKVKRAVLYPYMDFSTLEKRRLACEAEITVNRPGAPQLYIEVVPITRDRQGFHLGGTGAAVEWAVHLRRFDENATLDRIASRGELDAQLVDKLASAIVAAHRSAPICDGEAAVQGLRRVVEETSTTLLGALDLFPSHVLISYRRKLTEALERIEPLLHNRGVQGQVRRCHGDLHLGNIVLIDDAPILFDAIEFDDAIATSDILYDLAFLLMDLCERELRVEANRLLNRYLALCSDEHLQISGLAALPLFLSLRAAIRAKVILARLRLDPGQAALRGQVRGYFGAARRFLNFPGPILIAIGGLSGTGKSTLAAAIAPWIGAAPGAVHLRSDTQRKRLFGVAETTRLPSEAYRPDVSAQVYSRLAELARAGVNAGRAVIVDATYHHSGERVAIAAAAKELGICFIGIWLEAPTALLQRRVSLRRNDASDATAAVVEEQARAPLGWISWPHLDASQPMENMQAAALELIPKEFVFTSRSG